jgi:hypothetical protein
MQNKPVRSESNKLYLYFITAIGTCLLLLLTKTLGLITTFETKEIIFFVLSLSIVTATLDSPLREIRNDPSKFKSLILVSATVAPVVVTTMVVIFHSIT